jgi:hypothetical protein
VPVPLITMGVGVALPGIKFPRREFFDNNTIPPAQIRIKIPLSIRTYFVLNIFFRLSAMVKPSFYIMTLQSIARFPFLEFIQKMVIVLDYSTSRVKYISSPNPP